MQPEKISGDDPIERAEPRAGARKIAALSIRSAGVVLGVALTAFYIVVVWVSPPDLSRARPGAGFGMYLGLPLLFLFGPYWLADWLAAFVDKRRMN